MIILFLHDKKTEINYLPQSFSSLRMAQRALSALPDGTVDWDQTQVGWFLFDEFSVPENAIGSLVSVQTRDAFLAEDEPFDFFYGKKGDCPINLRGVKGDA